MVFEKRNFDIIKFLITNNKFDININKLYNDINGRKTILYLAVEMENKEIVEFNND